MRVALVHDYLTQRGGAERVFELLCNYFPDADIFTSLYTPESSINLANRAVKTTVLQNLPSADKYFRLLAPFYYPAFRSFDLSDYDLIISSTSSFAKGVIKGHRAKHICFCHNVTRFLWDTETYLRGYKEFQLFDPLICQVFAWMRNQDLQYAQGPDLYIANSTTVADRIQTIYGKKAIAINYPIDSSQFAFSDCKAEFYLASARLLGYKRMDVVVEAFNQLGWPLVILGDGPERARLEARAFKNITFLGHVSDIERTCLLSMAKSVVVAALEDYGLVPIEANFSGTPVICFGKGGVLDTQIDGETGIFFTEQTPESLRDALIQALSIQWNYAAIHAHAMSNFTEKVFFERIDQLLTPIYGELLQRETDPVLQSVASLPGAEKSPIKRRLAQTKTAFTNQT